MHTHRHILAAALTATHHAEAARAGPVETRQRTASVEAPVLHNPRTRADPRVHGADRRERCIEALNYAVAPRSCARAARRVPQTKPHWFTDVHNKIVFLHARCLNNTVSCDTPRCSRPLRERVLARVLHARFHSESQEYHFSARSRTRHRT